ncbi:MAG: hypothetical protein ACRC6A_04180, partial [Fusobacteriaceae bacterium]
MIKKALLSAMVLSSSVFCAEITTLTGSTTAIFAKESKSDKPFMYLADNFHEMATLPAFSMGVPSGLVGSYGAAFMGLSARRDSNDTDGALALGMGFGDANNIGGSASIGVGSIDPRDGGAFNRGDFNINVGHNFQQFGLGVSAGMNGVDLWHASSKDGENQNPSFYLATTKLLPNLLAPVAVTAGFGNNSFADINIEDSDRKDKLGAFGAVAVYVLPQLSLIVDYTSNVLTTGISTVPFPQYPISVNLGV